MVAPFGLLGTPRKGGLFIVCDHASNHVPPDIALGIDPALMQQHIAYDIGVAAVAERMVADGSCAAFLAQVSRLVCDLNRQEDAPGLAPEVSDGVDIAGNHLTPQGRAARVERFFRPYHAALAQALADAEPALILSLHSFTPQLATAAHQARPWHIGVLYNADERAPRLALPLLARQTLAGVPLCVGDQQPYSGRQLNATMNTHAEAHGRPYLGVEVRQDLIATPAGQAQWAALLAQVCAAVMAGLGADT
jgi:predicted N-formylglutamate amidohydrolase